MSQKRTKTEKVIAAWNNYRAALLKKLDLSEDDPVFQFVELNHFRQFALEIKETIEEEREQKFDRPVRRKRTQRSFIRRNRSDR